MRKLIGGYALVKLGSARHTEDIDYLINDETSKEMFIHDKEKNIDYINANGHPFFKEIYKIEEKHIGEIATPQTLLELKCFAFVQHCHNAHWQKADDAEYDIKFICREFNLDSVKTVQKYVGEGDLAEVMKVIKAVRK